MYYADLEIKELRKNKGRWYVCLNSSKEGNFVFPVADDDIAEEQLADKGIYPGKKVLAGIDNDKIVGIDGFSYIKTQIKKR